MKKLIKCSSINFYLLIFRLFKLQLNSFLSFHCGIGDEQTHIAEGLAFALEAFKNLDLRRKQK